MHDLGIRNDVEVAAASLQSGHLLGINVEPGDAATGVWANPDQSQAFIAEADDRYSPTRDGGRSLTNTIVSPGLVHVMTRTRRSRISTLSGCACAR